jgi:predicted dehydrogenase
MPVFRTLLLGCGARAIDHARAYATLDNMTLAAVCDLVEERRERFRADYNVPESFDDYEKALAAVQPDIVQCATSPGNRVWEAECAAKAGVRAFVVEKPMAIRPADLEGLTRVHEQYGMEIIQNCQRRYYPQFRDGVIREIANERLGDLYFVRASTRGNTMGMGPHTMDLLQFFLGDARPEAVWAMAHTINEESYQITHKAPESIMAQFWFNLGGRDVRALFDCSPDALGTPGEESFWMHLHFDFLGTKGRLYLTQNKGYWYQAEGMSEPVHGESSWDDQEYAGQHDFTRAVGQWLADGTPHLNRFENSRAVIAALLGAQKSVYEGARVSLPCEFTDDQWVALRERLRGT